MLTTGGSQGVCVTGTSVSVWRNGLVGILEILISPEMRLSIELFGICLYLLPNFKENVLIRNKPLPPCHAPPPPVTANLPEKQPSVQRPGIARPYLTKQGDAVTCTEAHFTATSGCEVVLSLRFQNLTF